MSATPVDPSWAKLAYLQIADDMTRRIDTGDVTLRLPGERGMAQEYETSIGTVRHALEVLRERSKIVTLPRGSFVASAVPNFRSADSS